MKKVPSKMSACTLPTGIELSDQKLQTEITSDASVYRCLSYVFIGTTVAGDHVSKANLTCS